MTLPSLWSTALSAACGRLSSTGDAGTCTVSIGSLAPDVVAATAAFLVAFLPALASAGSRPDGPVGYRLQGGLVDLTLSFDGTAWTVTEPHATASAFFSGSDSDLCLFALGRIDVDSPRITVAGDLAAARRLREYVPGA